MKRKATKQANTGRVLQLRDFPEDVRKMLERRAVDDGLTLTQVVSKAVAQYCQQAVIIEED